MLCTKNFTVTTQTQTFPNTEIFSIQGDTNHNESKPTHMVNNANLFSVDNHVNEVCNFAFPLLCRLRQANNWIILLQKSRCDIRNQKNFRK